MRSWSPGKVVAMWIGWYAVIFLALITSVDSNAGFALPLPTNVYVNGQQLSSALAISTFVAISLLVISLPPLLLTGIWWYQRRGRAS